MGLKGGGADEEDKKGLKGKLNYRQTCMFIHTLSLNLPDKSMSSTKRGYTGRLLKPRYEGKIASVEPVEY